MTTTNRSVVNDAHAIARTTRRGVIAFEPATPGDDPAATTDELADALAELLPDHHLLTDTTTGSLMNLPGIATLDAEGYSHALMAFEAAEMTADELRHHAAAQLVLAAVARRELDEATVAFHALIGAAKTRTATP